MKRMIPLFLAILLLLSGCAADPISAVTTQSVSATTATKPMYTVTADMEVFSLWLDGEGLQPGISGGDFLDGLARYSYNGIPVTEEVLTFYNFDGG